MDLADGVLHPVRVVGCQVVLEIFCAVFASRAIPAGEFAFLNVTERMIAASYDPYFGCHDEARIRKVAFRSL